MAGYVLDGQTHIESHVWNRRGCLKNVTLYSCPLTFVNFGNAFFALAINRAWLNVCYPPLSWVHLFCDVTFDIDIWYWLWAYAIWNTVAPMGQCQAKPNNDHLHVMGISHWYNRLNLMHESRLSRKVSIGHCLSQNRTEFCCVFQRLKADLTINLGGG